MPSITYWKHLYTNMAQVHNPRNFEQEVLVKPQRTKLRHIVRNQLGSLLSRKRRSDADQNEAQPPAKEQPGVARRMTLQISDGFNFANSIERFGWRRQKWYQQYGSSRLPRSRKPRGGIHAVSSNGNARSMSEPASPGLPFQAISRVLYSLPHMEYLRRAVSNTLQHVQGTGKITAGDSANTQTIAETETQCEPLN